MSQLPIQSWWPLARPMSRRRLFSLTSGLVLGWSAIQASCRGGTSDATPALPVREQAPQLVQVPGYDDPNRWRGRQLVVTSYGGALQDAMRQAFFEPFSRLTGCTIIEDFTDEAKLQTMVQAGDVQWDVVDLGTEAVIPFGRRGILESLDYARISTDGLFPELRLDYGIGWSFYSTCLAYRTDAFLSRPPNSWADFWDVSGFPGERALQKYAMYGPIEAALLADGVPADQLYPLDLDRAFRALNRIKPHIRVWWESGAQPAQLLSDGEIDLTDAWVSRIIILLEQGFQGISFTWNQGRLGSSCWVIPRGAKNSDVAYDFINFTLTAQTQEFFASLYPLGPANQRAFDNLSPERRRVLPSAPENKAVQVYPDYAWWAEHYTEVVERYNRWLTS
uniref:ABC transporter substrate-binding protein n=1 Tax=Thermomicrobium roseum TaxID=500 RepID=A0A7C5VVV0_THERO